MAKQTSESFDRAKREKRPVEKKTIERATQVVQNVEKSLLTEKKKAEKDGDKKSIQDTQQAALDVVRATAEISDTVACSLLGNCGGATSGTSPSKETLEFETDNFKIAVSTKQSSQVPGSKIQLGKGNNAVSFAMPVDGLNLGTQTELHTVLWDKNPFTYFEPSYDRNTSSWVDDSLNFPVASLRLREYDEQTGDATDLNVSNLIVPITITFPHQPSYDDAAASSKIDLVCVWWDEQTNEWSGDGCQSPVIGDDNKIQCSCTHLTNFAVRLKKAASSNLNIFQTNCHLILIFLPIFFSI